ncbi:MAG: nucleoside triphosphate pyrophosphohydrolase [Candidatus Eisenbacteria bacterium]|nr:nucleoside triphosphate pyrophosphohydrolase [Candidatus Eisenbacteria bacterium]
MKKGKGSLGETPPGRTAHKSTRPQESRKRTVEDLLHICRVLRGEDGCPWDKSQTITSLTPYILEETHEVIDAIAAGEHDKLKEEIGDLLFLLIFCVEIAEEKGLFTLDDVVRMSEEKMKRRHPHVFGLKTAKKTKDILRQWEEIKLMEEPSQTSLLEGASPTLSPLVASFRLQEKAAAVGFDWPGPQDVVKKIREELAELKEALSARDQEATGAEVGDLLFSLVNLARKTGQNPDVCLRRTMEKFRRRFAFVEESLRRRGKTPSGSTLEEMDGLWNEVKEREKRKERKKNRHRK